MGRGRMLAGVVVALLLAACGNVDATPLTDPSTTPTTSVTTAPPSTSSTTGASTAATTTATTVPAETVPVETVPVETVGSPAEFEAQIDAVYDRLGRFAAPRDEVPFPDATNIDPVVAFEDLINFHFWMMSTNPWRDWVPLYALDGTEYARDQRSLTNAYSSTTGLYYFDEEPFMFHEAAGIPVERIAIPDEQRSALGDDAVGLAFTSSSGDFYGAFSDTGEVIESIKGWNDQVGHAVLVPTDGGWRIGYLEWLP